MKRGFTLLEICIAMAILAVSLAVLVESEAGSVMMTVDSQQTLTANALAEEVMAQVLLGLEKEGITETDQSEEGDFGDFGADGRFGDGVDFEGEYDDFAYAWTVRRVDLQIGDASGAIQEIQAMGGEGNEDAQEASEGSMDASMLGSFLSPDMLNEMLSPWMREVRVLVWWGEDQGDLEPGETCEACVELVTHVFNQSGQIVGSEGTQ